MKKLTKLFGLFLRKLAQSVFVMITSDIRNPLYPLEIGYDPCRNGTDALINLDLESNGVSQNMVTQIYIVI